MSAGDNMSEKMELLKTHHSERVCKRIVHRTKKEVKPAITDNVFNCLKCDRNVRQTQQNIRNSCDKVIEILRNHQEIVELNELQLHLSKCDEEMEEVRKNLTRIRDYFYDTCAECRTNLENIDSWLCLVEAEGN